MKMKKLLAIVLMATAVTFTACGGDSKEAGSTAEATKEEKKEYAPGKVTDTGYESEFLGLRFTTPEGFTLTAGEELNSLMGEAADAIDDQMNEAQKKAAELAVVYEMMVMNETGANATIALEKTSASVDEYVKSFKSQASELAIQGMSLKIEGDAEEVELAGAAYTKLAGCVEAENMNIKQDYYFRKVGDRMMYITVINVNDDAGVEALMGGFEAY